MPHYRVSLTVEAGSEPMVRKILASAFSTVQGQTAQVEKLGGKKSRADRLAVAETQIEDAKSIVEELLEEMQSWHDSIPENLQDGGKANEVQEAISALEEIQGALDGADCSSVSFPGMM